MRCYTNLAWPEDPYRTGQQLYRRTGPRLAAFSLYHSGLTAAAIVYLPLNRTQTLPVTARTLAFGFHAVSISDPAEAPTLARAVDLYLLQACHHAAILAGHLLPDDLAALTELALGTPLRGVTATGQAWAHRAAADRGRAAMLDCGHDLPGIKSLARLCTLAHVSCPACTEALEPTGDEEEAAARVTGRAMALALAAARYLGRYRWEGILSVDEVLAIGAWDCFPHVFTQPCAP
jgi:hypothetical protein